MEECGKLLIEMTRQGVIIDESNVLCRACGAVVKLSDYIPFEARNWIFHLRTCSIERRMPSCSNSPSLSTSSVNKKQRRVVRKPLASQREHLSRRGDRKTEKMTDKKKLSTLVPKDSRDSQEMKKVTLRYLLPKKPDVLFDTRLNTEKCNLKHDIVGRATKQSEKCNARMVIGTGELAPFRFFAPSIPQKKPAEVSHIRNAAKSTTSKSQNEQLPLSTLTSDDPTRHESTATNINCSSSPHPSEPASLMCHHASRGPLENEDDATANERTDIQGVKPINERCNYIPIESTTIVPPISLSGTRLTGFPLSPRLSPLPIRAIKQRNESVAKLTTAHPTFPINVPPLSSWYPAPSIFSPLSIPPIGPPPSLNHIAVNQPVKVYPSCSGEGTVLQLPATRITPIHLPDLPLTAFIDLPSGRTTRGEQMKQAAQMYYQKHPITPGSLTP